MNVKRVYLGADVAKAGIVVAGVAAGTGLAGAPARHRLTAAVAAGLHVHVWSHAAPVNFATRSGVALKLPPVAVARNGR